MNTIAFLTNIEKKQFGFFGGYLVLNLMGQPLEFHCTTPVKPNRAQKILYGPTLRPFLFSERLGETLVRKSRQSADVIFVDQPEVLPLGAHVKKPVVLVLEEDDPPEDGLIIQPCLELFLAMPQEDEKTLTGITLELENEQPGVHLFEPFDRIREAIGEALGAMAPRKAA